MLDIFLEQNYLQFNKKIFGQDEGLTMVAPTSAILAEKFTQRLEHTIIYIILNKHQNIVYHEYGDDKLIVYNVKSHGIS
jgi:hypothetical protein